MKLRRCLLIIGLAMLSATLQGLQIAEYSEFYPHAGTQSEIRSLWALPWDISSPAQVSKLVETAINSHQNELLVEVRYRSDALYNTSRGAAMFQNPEPRSHVLEIADYDPLLDVLELAHAAGIKVHAWVIVFNATPLDQALLKRNYIYQNHPEWITYDKQHRRMNSNAQYGYFIDPGIPEVQDYLLGIIGNLISGYPDLDGIQLDYIRYPNENLGYHPVSLERYRQYCRERDEISFNEWRIKQVSEFVKRFQNLVKGIDPEMVTSAAVFADIADASTSYAQDWTAWLREGYIDRVYPMAYSTKLEVFSKQLKQYQLLQRNKDIVVGIRAWRDDGASLLTNNGYGIDDVAQRVEQVRSYEFGGMALFSYAGIKAENVWKLLTEISYPAMVPAPQKPVEPPRPKISFSPEVDETGYNLKLCLPKAGLWKWTIENNELRYDHHDFYSEGENDLYWDGMAIQKSSGKASPLPAGDYIVQLYLDGADYQYMIPVTFAGMP